jgi:simple sugar transport system ATP-binding protein
VREWARRLIERFAIHAESEVQPAGALSGGNQQKIVVGRALESDRSLIIAVNPTRGLDIRATADVRRRLREAADAGRAVVLLSTDLEELDEVADHVKYLGAGRFVEGAGREALLGGR